jgi:uncharacterized membrane protein YhaH (DUF805 family)
MDKEGLKFARLLMVISSVAPLFVLWGIRGNTPLPNQWFISICALFVVIPNVVLGLRILVARKRSDKKEIIVARSEDHREHILIYLFAMLLPLYAIDMSSWSTFSATIVALGFIVFLFWHLNLHYINLIFAFFGFRIFTVYPPTDNNPYSGRDTLIVISRKSMLLPGDQLQTYRLSNTVFLEVK